MLTWGHVVAFVFGAVAMLVGLALLPDDLMARARRAELEEQAAREREFLRTHTPTWTPTSTGPRPAPARETAQVRACGRPYQGSPSVRCHLSILHTGLHAADIHDGGLVMWP